MSITVFICDDHAVVRDGLRFMLEAQGNIKVIGEASNGREAVKKVKELKPDIVIMDVSMPPILSGLEATRWICGNWPNVKVIALSMHKQKQYVTEMLKAGAQGYLLKDCDSDELLAAIRAVARGEVYVSESIDISKPTDHVVGQ